MSQLEGDYGPIGGGGSSANGTTAAAVIPATAIVVGDDGARGIKGSGAEVNASGYVGVTGAAATGGGATEVPSLYNKADTNTGVGVHGSDVVSLIGGGKALAWQGPANILGGDNSFQIGWNNTASGAFGAGSDTGIGRNGAGVVKFTDASTGIRGLMGGGAAVASAAALPVPTGRVFHVTGTTNITSITSTNFQAGVVTTMIFDGILTVTDGNNLKLVGNFVTAANSTLTLIYDGTNWFELCRSAPG